MLVHTFNRAEKKKKKACSVEIRVINRGNFGDKKEEIVVFSIERKEAKKKEKKVTNGTNI